MGLYDNIRLSNAEYVPKFIGSNVKELSEASQIIGDRYQRNKDYSDKIAMVMANEQYLQADKGIKDKLAQSIYGSIKEIGSSDANFENSTAAVSQLARDFYTNQHRIAALDNYKRVENAKQLQTQLGADALNFGDDPNSFSTLDADGNTRRFNLGIEKRQDYSKKMQELLGKVATDGYTTDPTGQQIQFNDYERLLIKTGQVQHLSPDKLNKLVEGLIPSYKNSAEGQQDVRRLTTLEGFKHEPITLSNGKLTRQTTPVDENIRQRFRAVAAPQAFSQSNIRWDDFGVPVSKAGNGNLPPTGNYSPTQPGSVTDNTSFNPVKTTEEEFTLTGQDGKYYQFINKTTGQPAPIDEIREAAKGTGSTGGGSAYGVAEKLADYEQVEVDKGQAEQAMASNYQKVITTIPGAKDGYKTYEEYKAAYNEASKNHAKITPSGNRVEPEQAAQYDDLINRSIASSPLYFADSRKPVQGLQQLAESIGTAPSNINLKTINVFYDSPRKDLPGGYIEAKVEVKDSKVTNHPTSVFIPLNDQFAGLAEPIDNLYKNSFYQGQDTYTPEKPYVPQIGGRPMTNGQGEMLAFYTVTYPLPKNQQVKGKPGFRTMVYSGKVSPNGNGGQDINWQQDPMSIGSWKQQMVEALSPLFKTALNSGQTFNVTDYKKQGLEY